MKKDDKEDKHFGTKFVLFLAASFLWFIYRDGDYLFNRDSQDDGYYYQPNNQQENDSHFVNPHERELPNGETIWVDGDGDTSVDRGADEGGGWYQGNPE